MTVGNGHQEKANEIQHYIDKLKEVLFLSQQINP